MTAEKPEKQNQNIVKISDDVIISNVVNAVLSTEGIASMSGGFSNTISKNFLGKESAKKGVKLSKDEEELVVDISVIIKFGFKIPEAAWAVQKKVKKALADTIEMPIKSINVNIQGVDFK